MNCLHLFKPRRGRRYWWIRDQLEENLKFNSNNLQLEELSMLSANQLFFYSQLVKDVGPILRNSFLCKIMLLLATTYTTEASGGQMPNLHSTILKIFWKKMFDKYSKQSSAEEAENCEERVSNISHTFVGEMLTGLNKIWSFCTMLKAWLARKCSLVLRFKKFNKLSNVSILKKSSFIRSVVSNTGPKCPGVSYL